MIKSDRQGVSHKMAAVDESLKVHRKSFRTSISLSQEHLFISEKKAIKYLETGAICKQTHFVAAIISFPLSPAHKKISRDKLISLRTFSITNKPFKNTNQIRLFSFRVYIYSMIRRFNFESYNR